MLCIFTYLCHSRIIFVTYLCQFHVLIALTENGVSRHRLLETRLNYDPTHTAYTHGMDVQQVSLSGDDAVTLMTLM